MAHPARIFPDHARADATSSRAHSYPAIASGSDRHVRVNPAPLLLALVDEYRIQARDRGVALRLALSTALPAIHTDRERLARLLCLVVGNAVESAPRGGTVTVTATLKAGDVVFTVRDSGADDGSVFRIAVPAPTDD